MYEKQINKLFSFSITKTIFLDGINKEFMPWREWTQKLPLYQQLPLFNVVELVFEVQSIKKFMFFFSNYAMGFPHRNEIMSVYTQTSIHSIHYLYYFVTHVGGQMTKTNIFNQKKYVWLEKENWPHL